MTNQPRALTLTEREDGIAVLEINVPNDAQNTLKAEFGDDFEAAWANINKAKPKAIVVYSTKPGSFVAGADINMFNELNSASAVTELSRLGQEKFQLLENLDIPVVAAIAGACLGGGMELALACSCRQQQQHSAWLARGDAWPAPSRWRHPAFAPYRGHCHSPRPDAHWPPIAPQASFESRLSG